MSAKNCPETTRQKMINMMYLVLTAMLALNVASEVLESFRIIDASLIQTLNNVQSKNNQIYNNFAAAEQQNPQKVKEWKDKSDQVKQKTMEMVTRIQDLKEEMVVKSGSISQRNDREDFNLSPDKPTIVTSKGDTLKIVKEDDLNVPSEVMINKKKGTELKNSLNEYRDFLISYLAADDPLRENINKQLATLDEKPNLKEGGERKTWEVVHFESKPLIAVVTLLSKMQIDVENAETSIISKFYSNIDAASFKFNKLSARILPTSNYVIKGDQFEAEVYLAAIDTTQDPEIYVGNTKLTKRNGRFIYTAPANEVGTFKWGGLIKFKNPEGNVVPYKFEGEYQVGNPSVTISPTKMNVLYLGIGNPVKISVPGIASEDLSPTITNGRMEKKGDTYMVYPTKLDVTGKNTSISVTATKNGEKRFMGSMEFRVKEVPPPLATVSGKNSGVLRKEDLQAEQGVFADLKDFDFDLKFKVTQFDITFSSAGGFSKSMKGDGNKFTQEQKDQFAKLSQGSVIIIDNIMARGDDGSNRPLSPVTFKIK
ncbi:MAG TPA: gliding motility protein GldM [Prolixibacteraceae bacterium]|nr:gliding motility protein GldM [Prolixibacteraceae bacterium]